MKIPSRSRCVFGLMMFVEKVDDDDDVDDDVEHRK